MIEQGQKLAIERAWLKRAKAQDIKPGSVGYRKSEVDFFAGAMATLEALFPNLDSDAMSESIPPIWVIHAMSGRPIVDRKAELDPA